MSIYDLCIVYKPQEESSNLSTKKKKQRKAVILFARGAIFLCLFDIPF